MKNISYFFFPKDKDVFKRKAIGNIVRTMIVDLDTFNIKSYTRNVNVIWAQTRKNNVESDKRVKDLHDGNYHIYSWVVTNKDDFNLPSFTED